MSRILLLLIGIEFIVIFLQVTLFHTRQNFRHWSMWIPVLATPIFGIAALLLTVYNADWLRGVFCVLLGIGVIAGVFGTGMHIRGVGQRVDGYKLRNFMVGPPAFLPGLIVATCLFGYIALYWR